MERSLLGLIRLYQTFDWGGEDLLSIVPAFTVQSVSTKGYLMSEQ